MVVTLCVPFISLFNLLKLRFIYLFEMHTERGSDNLPIGLLHRWLQSLGLGQAEVRILELHQYEDRDPST